MVLQHDCMPIKHQPYHPRAGRELLHTPTKQHWGPYIKVRLSHGRGKLADQTQCMKFSPWRQIACIFWGQPHLSSMREEGACPLDLCLSSCGKRLRSSALLLTACRASSSSRWRPPLDSCLLPLACLSRASLPSCCLRDLQEGLVQKLCKGAGSLLGCIVVVQLVLLSCWCIRQLAH